MQISDKDIIDQYVSRLYAERTRDMYLAEINRFLKDTNKTITQLTETDIYKYQSIIQEYKLKNGEVRKTSSSTIARRLSIIRVFLTFIYRRKYITTDLSIEIELPKVNQKHPDILTEDEAMALLRTPDKRSIKGLRDYLILRVFLLTGCRLQELIDINWEDFSRKYNYLTLTLRGKGNKERLVKITKDLEDELTEYRNKRTFSPKTPLFMTTSIRNLKPARISAISIRNMLSKYVKKALIDKNITPHSLRHTCFSLEAAHGADVFKIMEQAGHTSILVTQRYVRSFNNLDNNGVDFNPLCNKDKEVFK